MSYPMMDSRFRADNKVIGVFRAHADTEVCLSFDQHRYMLAERDARTLALLLLRAIGYEQAKVIAELAKEK